MMMRKLGLRRSSSRPNTRSDSALEVERPSSNDSLVVASQVYEAPLLPAETLIALRTACALIVAETGPSGAELEAINNQPDPLESYQRDARRAARHPAQPPYAASKTSRHQQRPGPDNVLSRDKSSSTVPQSASVKAVKSSQGIASSQNLLDPAAIATSTSAPGTKHRSHDNVKDERVLAEVRAAMGVRPKTSAAACIDYSSHSPGSSASMTRSNTTHENHISTGLTSMVGTPADEKRSSNKDSAFPPRHSSRDAQAREWIAQELARRERAREDASLEAQYSAPTLRYTYSRTSLRDTSRPRSRAGSIRDNIFGGIRDYIQPRPSLNVSRIQSRDISRVESRASSRAESRSSSRLGSRSSSLSRGWLRNAASGLRRKGSFSSFRSSREDEEEERGRRKDKGPDLNRSLPPLPGLDQYKEPKTHIAQLLARPVAKVAPPAATAAAPPHVLTDGMTSSQPITPSMKVQTAPAASRSFPRIPFAEDDAVAAHSPLSADSSRSARWQPSPTNDGRRHTSGSSERASRHGSSKGHEHKSPKQHSTGASTTLTDEREEEIRRAVREKMMQGGLHLSETQSQCLGLDNKDLNRIAAKHKSRSGADSQSYGRLVVGAQPAGRPNAEDRPRRRSSDRTRAQPPIREERTRPAVSGRQSSNGHKNGRSSHGPSAPRYDPAPRKNPSSRPRHWPILPQGMPDAHQPYAPSSLPSAAPKKGLKNRLSRLLGGNGTQGRAIAAN